MFFTIHVKLNKNKDGVEKISDTEFVIYTKKPAVENKANEDIIKQLASHLRVSKADIRIVRGLKAKKKIIEIGC